MVRNREWKGETERNPCRLAQSGRRSTNPDHAALSGLIGANSTTGPPYRCAHPRTAEDGRHRPEGLGSTGLREPSHARYRRLRVPRSSQRVTKRTQQSEQQRHGRQARQGALQSFMNGIKASRTTRRARWQIIVLPALNGRSCACGTCWPRARPWRTEPPRFRAVDDQDGQGDTRGLLLVSKRWPTRLAGGTGS